MLEFERQQAKKQRLLSSCDFSVTNFQSHQQATKRRWGQLYKVAPNKTLVQLLRTQPPCDQTRPLLSAKVNVKILSTAKICLSKVSVPLCEALLQSCRKLLEEIRSAFSIFTSFAGKFYNICVKIYVANLTHFFISHFLFWKLVDFKIKTTCFEIWIISLLQKQIH